MIDYSSLILEALECPPQKVAYFVTQKLEELSPDKEVFCASAGSFQLPSYAEETGNCEVSLREDAIAEVIWDWRSANHPLSRSLPNCAHKIQWQGHELDCLHLTWPDGLFGTKRLCWLIGESVDIARQLYREVCAWSTEIRGEVLVFHGGCWSKDEELFESIQGSTADNLILKDGLKQSIFDDFQKFFESKDVYKRYGIPWKRGVLFLGPPGNGKSHAVKALINQFNLPCLYVKTLKTDHGTEHSNIRSIFSRARDTAPCLLVFEDLESHIHDENRAFFLNELDGFAANEGLLTLATTNYPGKLDPAILERPSRFDRKYTFSLPEQPERLRYLGWWNGRLEDELKLSSAELESLAQETDGFSFAYLKELVLSGMMSWFEVRGSLHDSMTGQLRTLLSQMKTEVEKGPQKTGPSSPYDILKNLSP
jgi:ATPase family protein associated with various cellular activities (AAA)